jgi:hypothetical protein
MTPNTWQRVMGSMDVKRFWVRCKMRLKILPKPPRNPKMPFGEFMMLICQAWASGLYFGCRSLCYQQKN